MNNTLRFTIDTLSDNESLGLEIQMPNGQETPFFAVKKQRHIFVYQNFCPHLGLPLEWMPHQFLDREGHYIQCATHGALFRLDNGLCVSGPCQGESLKAIPYRIDENSLIISSEHFTQK